MFIYFEFKLNTKKKQIFAETNLLIKKAPTFKLFPIGPNKK